MGEEKLVVKVRDNWEIDRIEIFIYRQEEEGRNVARVDHGDLSFRAFIPGAQLPATLSLRRSTAEDLLCQLQKCMRASDEPDKQVESEVPRTEFAIGQMVKIKISGQLAQVLSRSDKGYYACRMGLETPRGKDMYGLEWFYGFELAPWTEPA